MPSVISGDANVSATEFGYLDGVTSAIQTQLNGKISSIACDTALVSTGQTTTSTSYTDLSTVGPTVTLITGTKALVVGQAFMWGAVNDYARMSVAVSGASTISASDDYCASIYTISGGSDLDNRNTTTFGMLFTTLTAGSNTFTAKYKSVSGGTATFEVRRLIVVNLGS